jgi:dTDP-4-amino-4,6-dideoxygalactose transaminase
MTFSIAFNDFKRDPEDLVQAELAAVDDVIRSGWWVLGQQVKAFETAWAKRCMSVGCVGVANGLDAIEIGLRALGIGPGDEVITTSLTAYATTLAIQRCGAIPVFADIDPATACLCPSSIEKSIGAKTKALLVVHLYGRAADLPRLIALCKRHSIYLIEDCAQAHLAQSNDQSVGSFGAFGAWSFYPTKNLGAIGDAGAITSSNPELLEKALHLRNYGQKDRYHHVIAGMNSRLDELQAAILLQRLPYLDSWTTLRRQIACRYWDEIDNDFLVPLSRPDDSSNHVHHLFVVTANQREAVQRKLLERGVQTLIHYPVPSHMQKALGTHRLPLGGLPATEYHCNHCLSLPIHPYLSDAEVDHVIRSCNDLSA